MATIMIEADLKQEENKLYFDQVTKCLDENGYGKYPSVVIHEKEIAGSIDRLYLSIDFDSKMYKIWGFEIGVVKPMTDIGLRPVAISWIATNLEDLIINPMDDRLVTILSKISYRIWIDKLLNKNNK